MIQEGMVLEEELDDITDSLAGESDIDAILEVGPRPSLRTCETVDSLDTSTITNRVPTLKFDPIAESQPVRDESAGDTNIATVGWTP